MNMCPKFFLLKIAVFFVGSSPAPKAVKYVQGIQKSPQTHHKMRQGLDFHLKEESNHLDNNFLKGID